MLHVQAEHLTITRELNQKVATNSKALTRLTAKVGKVFIEIEERWKQIKKDTDRHTALLGLYINASVAVRELEMSALLALIDIRSLYQALGALATGSTGIELIRPTELSKILVDVDKLLPEGFSLVTGTSVSDVHPYYELAEVHAVTNGRAVFIFMDLPLIAPRRKFTPYRIVRVPVKDPHTGLFIILQEKALYYLLSEDREFYALVYEEINNWLYSIEAPTRVISKCFLRNGTSGPPTEEVIQGVGRITAAPGCTLYTEDCTLLPHTQGVLLGDSSLKSEIVPSLPLLHLVLEEEPKESEVQQALADLRDDEELHLGDFNLREAQLTRLLHRVDQQKASRRVKTWTVSGGAAVLLLVLVLIAVVWGWRRIRDRQGLSASPVIVSVSRDANVTDFTVRHPTSE